MNDPATVAAVLANLAIAFAYLGIGIYVTPKFSLAAPSRGSRLAKLLGLTFFVTCGMTHLALSAHALRQGEGTSHAHGEWLVGWHGQLVHGVQAVAGIGFLVLAMRYLQIRIYNKDYYEQVLDERIRSIEDQLERAS